MISRSINIILENRCNVNSKSKFFSKKNKKAAEGGIPPQRETGPDQPFTPPSMIPLTSCFCSRTKMMIIGTTLIVTAAISRWVCCPCEA